MMSVDCFSISIRNTINNRLINYLSNILIKKGVLLYYVE